MVMIRPGGKAKAIASRVMRGKGIKIPSTKSSKMKPLQQPFLQHQAKMKKKSKTDLVERGLGERPKKQPTKIDPKMDPRDETKNLMKGIGKISKKSK